MPALDLFLSNRKEWNHAIRVEYVIFGAKITTISGVLDPNSNPFIVLPQVLHDLPNSILAAHLEAQDMICLLDMAYSCPELK